MQIGTRIIGSVTVWSLAGRWDASGAAVFEVQIAALAPDCRWMALDMGGVPFMSSLGIRSLLRLNRRLQEGNGALALCGVQPFVHDVLSMAGLADHLTMAGSVEDGVSHLEAACAAAENCETLTLRGCAFHVRSLPVVEEAGLFWRAAAPPGTPALAAVHLDELGPAFGTGGFGVNRAEAAGELGLFLSTGRAVALCPADGRNVADLLISTRPERTLLYVREGVGLPASPSHAVEAPDFEGTLAEILEALPGCLGSATFGVAMLAETGAFAGGYYRTAADMERDDWSRRKMSGKHTVFLLGCVTRDSPFRGHALILDKPVSAFPRELSDVMTAAEDPEAIHDLLAVDPASLRIRAPRLWCHAPLTLEDGMSRQLAIETPPDAPFHDEWEVLVRRIYKDAGRVRLRALHGGFSSTTYHVESEDSVGRRMIPTVLKIASPLMTSREESAYRDCVEKFILNNSTVIMGKAEQGDWSGIRYNFVGVNGPESSLTWLARHYTDRTVEDLEPLWDALFHRVLRPWYGQSVRSTVHPFVDHDPVHLFGHMSEHAEAALGIRADAETVDCPEVGCSLPNPYLFHARDFERHRSLTRDWYTSITHGDLNLNNVLLDEKENLYVIDFSETAVRSVVSDFARLEPLLMIQTTRMADERDAAGVLEVWAGLLSVDPLREPPPFVYRGDDPLVRKAYETIRLLRGYAARASRGQDDPLAYWLPLLQWTLPLVSFVQMPVRYKRVSMVAAALICRRILEVL